MRPQTAVLLAATALALMMAPSCAKIERSKVHVFTSTEYYIEKGVKKYEIYFQYQSPCEFIPEGPVYNDIRKECQTEFSNTWLHAFEKFVSCKPSKRLKRHPFVVLAFVVVLVVDIYSITSILSICSIIATVLTCIWRCAGNNAPVNIIQPAQPGNNDGAAVAHEMYDMVREQLQAQIQSQSQADVRAFYKALEAMRGRTARIE